MKYQSVVLVVSLIFVFYMVSSAEGAESPKNGSGKVIFRNRSNNGSANTRSSRPMLRTGFESNETDFVYNGTDFMDNEMKNDEYSRPLVSVDTEISELQTESPIDTTPQTTAPTDTNGSGSINFSKWRKRGPSK